MRLSSLSLFALVLVFSFFAFAQHSSGGGGGSGGSSSSSSSSGGGSHSGSSGASSAGSSGGHSSGAGSYNSGGGHASFSGVTRGSGAGRSPSNGANVPTSSSRAPDRRLSPHGASPGSQPRPVQTAIAPANEKRGFFSFLRHPFRKPEPKNGPLQGPEGPICFRGPCFACPIGQVRAGSGCSAAVVPIRGNHGCSHRDLWNGGACLTQVAFLDDCAGLRLAVDRQLRRMRDAEIQVHSLCSGGTNQACSDATLNWNSEQSFYRTLQARYHACLASSTNIRYLGRFNATAFGYMRFDPLTVEINH